eukprot:CAMPEP_0185782624 /NCGR_PEP_ID=MMETSP1174-20130828/110328_1 /TAXON_ID=35687 /ORGANISM="Dictyocha speculum, Strain CCMP1381" /LENGTH=84 /DNA_ID=CAMNT_0028473185 /DNA_START=29 /DNA_END=280 /DNA_ORIENTATION=-
MCVIFAPARARCAALLPLSVFWAINLQRPLGRMASTTTSQRRHPLADTVMGSTMPIESETCATGEWMAAAMASASATRRPPDSA